MQATKSPAFSPNKMKNSDDKRPRNRRASDADNNTVDRRSFVKLVPAIGAAVLTAPQLAASAVAQTATPTPAASPSPTPAPLRVTKDMLKQAEKLIGIELTDAQEAMALQNVSTNLDRLRSATQDRHSARHRAGHAVSSGVARQGVYAQPLKFKLSKIEAPKFSSVDELAFAPLTQLAELVRTRRVSPVELTKMYLARLKKFGPKLNCVVTLTEELALAQASEAEREIKAGKYRGPLHGIPWGAKDLFATKGIRTTWGAEPYREQVIRLRRTVVERLREPGACWSPNFLWAHWRRAAAGLPE
jgi:hypothetical protein